MKTPDTTSQTPQQSDIESFSQTLQEKLPNLNDREFIWLIEAIKARDTTIAREARIDERKRAIGEWNAAAAKYGSLYNKRIYAIAKDGEKRLSELNKGDS